MSKQLLLPLEIPKQKWEHEDFIIGLSNLDAFNAINTTNLWLQNILLIIGPAKCGKSMLAKIWTEKTGAMIFANTKELYEKMPNYIVIDDLDAINSEIELFLLIEYVKQNNAFLLITAKNIPNYALPDLKSRINAIFKVIISEPDYALMRDLMLKKFAALQLEIDIFVTEYILNRSNRTYESIISTVDIISMYSFQYKKPVTINAMKKVLEL